MGRGCNRLTRKMKQLRSKKKAKARDARKCVEKYKARTGKEAPPAKRA